MYPSSDSGDYRENLHSFGGCFVVKSSRSWQKRCGTRKHRVEAPSLEERLIVAGMPRCRLGSIEQCRYCFEIAANTDTPRDTPQW